MAMTDIEQKAWVASLQPGDEVVYDASRFGVGASYNTLKVVRRTPGGKIRLSNDCLADERGRFGNSGSGYWLQPLTDDIRAKMIRKELREDVQHGADNTALFAHISTEELQQIASIFTAARKRREDKQLQKIERS